MIEGNEQRLGSQYVLDERIGRGAMGTVWRGRDTDTGEPVAIKILAEELCEDPDVLARFVQERTVLLGIRHQNLVSVHDMVVERNRLALVMDLVPGGDLSRLLRSSGVLTPAQTTGLAAQICAALNAVHQAGVVHRDLKPANVLLDMNGPRPVVRLADFGVARIADRSRITARTSIVGTPSYLAPELIRGEEPVPASDVYALGITLYELLVGRPPFDGDTVLTVLHRHLEDSARRVPGIPDSLWAVIEACLSKDPEDRPDAAAIGTQLVQALPGMIGLPAVTPPTPEDWLSDEEHGQTGSVVYAMPETFYGKKQAVSASADHDQVWPVALAAGVAAGAAAGAGVGAAAGSMDPTEQIPKVRADFRGYGPPPGQSISQSGAVATSAPTPALAPTPTPTQAQAPIPQRQPQNQSTAPQSAMTSGPWAGIPHQGNPPVGPPPVIPGPFDGAERHGGPNRRRRRTAVIAGSVASVLLISGAVTLAVADNGSSTPQPKHSENPAAFGAGNPSGTPLVTLGTSPSATTSTSPTATASATSTATASGKTAPNAPKGTATTSATPTAAPVVDFALHAKVTVSSNVGAANFSAVNLTNGDFRATSTDEGWSSKKDTGAGATEWVTVELATAQNVNDVNLYPRVFEGKTSCFPSAFTIATSTDGTHWTTVASETGYQASGLGVQGFSFAKLSAKYIKVTATALTQDYYKNYYFQLQQISVY